MTPSHKADLKRKNSTNNKQSPKCMAEMEKICKLSLVTLSLSIQAILFSQNQIDSISISDYNSKCVEVVREAYSIEKDSMGFIYSNGLQRLLISNFEYRIIESLFAYDKLSIRSINTIINNGKSIPGFNTFYSGGNTDLSDYLIENSAGTYRLIELFIMNDSGHPDSIHILLYCETANKLTDLLDFIEKSKLICLKYNHSQI